MGILGEPATPSDPANGKVWLSITQLIDSVNSENSFVSISDSGRDAFEKHPWSVGGGGASELTAIIEDSAVSVLGNYVEAIGRGMHTGADDVYFAPKGCIRRFGVKQRNVISAIKGEDVRDWTIVETQEALFPYDADLSPCQPLPGEVAKYVWPVRSVLRARRELGGTHEEIGLTWFEWSRFHPERLRATSKMGTANIATHMHCAVDRGFRVFDVTGPLIKLPDSIDENEQVAITGILNSSTCCFWLKQVCHNKGSTVDQRGARQRTAPFEDFFVYNSTKLNKVPLPNGRPQEVSRQLEAHSREIRRVEPTAVMNTYLSKVDGLPLRSVLGEAETNTRFIRGNMIRLQDDLDWQCYQLYGLSDEGRTSDIQSLPIQLGQRAFEIVLARKMARGEVQTTWFERHGSTPITEIPEDWPDDYKKLVERRIEVIESNPQIALIEQPEYKRRWNTEPWDSQVERALRSWLLDRLESYLDFDGRMNDDGKATAHASLREPRLISTAQFADIARVDQEFMEVAAVFRDRTDFDVAKLVADLVADESVPLLPVLRYKANALDTRHAWERTWELQRMEDHIEAELTEAFTRNDTPPALHDAIELADADEVPFARDVFFDRETMAPLFQQLSFEELVKRAKEIHIGEIPVPPKYKSSDFQSSVYWRLRGKLDVPKERWVSFPHCEGEDQSLVIAWAGYDHLQLTNAVAAFFADVQQTGGSEDPRLVPLLGCILELNPWVKQWHNDVDPDFGYRLGDYFANFVEDEARTLGKTVDDIRGWQPPAMKSQKKKRTKKS
jgi:hypothetical protein